MESIVSNSIFYQMAIILTACAIFGVISKRLKQPLLLAFIFAGFVLGPSGLNLIHAGKEIELLAQIGIAILLFTVGLQLDLSSITKLGKTLLGTSVLQTLGIFILGYIVSLLSGFNPIQSIYLAFTVAFSSTIVVVKILSDKKEISSLHGRLALGVLIIQDILAILAMILLSSLSQGALGSGLLTSLPVMLVKGFFLLVLTGFVWKVVAPRMMKKIHQSPELVVLIGIGLALVFAAIAEYAGFSKEIGAFLAGVALAPHDEIDQVTDKFSTIQNFLIIFFFIDIGLNLKLSNGHDQFIVAAVLSLIILIIKPLLTLILLGMFGLRKRTSAMTAFSNSQTSEFSLFIAVLGMSLGHVGEDLLGIITLVLMITFLFSSYMMISADKLYSFLLPVLKYFEKKSHAKEDEIIDYLAYKSLYKDGVDFIIIGLGHYGSTIAHELKRQGGKVLGVDFDPELVKMWKGSPGESRYIDITDPEFFKYLPVDKARWIINTIPKKSVNLDIMEALENCEFKGRIALASHDIEDLEEYRRVGADVTLMPFRDAAKMAAELITTRDQEVLFH